MSFIHLSISAQSRHVDIKIRSLTSVCDVSCAWSFHADNCGRGCRGIFDLRDGFARDTGYIHTKSFVWMISRRLYLSNTELSVIMSFLVDDIHRVDAPPFLSAPAVNPHNFTGNNFMHVASPQPTPLNYNTISQHMSNGSGVLSLREGVSLGVGKSDMRNQSKQAPLSFESVCKAHGMSFETMSALKNMKSREVSMSTKGGKSTNPSLSAPLPRKTKQVASAMKEATKGGKLGSDVSASLQRSVSQSKSQGSAKLKQGGQIPESNRVSRGAKPERKTTTPRHKSETRSRIDSDHELAAGYEFVRKLSELRR